MSREHLTAECWITGQRECSMILTFPGELHFRDFPFGVNPHEISTSISLRISTSALPFGKTFGVRFTTSIASSSEFT